MASETVRIRPETHAQLKALAKQSGQSMPELLDKAIEAYRRRLFLEEGNREFAALRTDRKAWEQEQKERAEWQNTLTDDLKDD
ncbi:MAG: hypothetical protein WD847_00065 [Pirellulales bacterium]